LLGFPLDHGDLESRACQFRKLCSSLGPHKPEALKCHSGRKIEAKSNNFFFSYLSVGKTILP
jgi:hypothetical protein